MAEYKPTGRPSYYEQKIKPHLSKIEKWITEDDLTLTDIARKLKISRKTLHKYINEESDLSNVVKKRDEIDKNYEATYMKQLNGYYVEEVTTNYIFKEQPDGTYKKIAVSEVKNKKYIKANDSMYIFAAKNKLKWTDRTEQGNQLGSEDDPITISIKQEMKK